MLSYYIYSHAYELEYSCYVIILIYELVYSLYVMRVAYMTLCLTTHITYIIGIRAKLRWWFIVPLFIGLGTTTRPLGPFVASLPAVNSGGCPHHSHPLKQGPSSDTK